jgi:hypothetical protein
MHHPVFNTKNSVFCPYSVFMYSVWSSQQMAIISLLNIYQLVLPMEADCALREVQTASL